jgi:hypothetical protein
MAVQEAVKGENKTSFQDEGEMETFTGIQEGREFLSS